MPTNNASIDSVLHAVAAPLLVCQQDRIVFANRAAQSLTGYASSQFHNLALQALLPAYEPNSTSDVPFESQLVTADGRYMPVQIYVSGTDYAGTPATLLTLRDVASNRQTEALDITQRKQAEEQLRQSQHLLQQITDMVPLDIYIYDLNQHRNVFHNRHSNLGYSPEEIRSKQDFFADLVHPDDRQKHVAKSQRLLQAKDGEIIESEDRMLHASGDYRWYYFRDIVFSRNPDGTPSQFLGSQQDITARKEAEEALRRNAEQLSLITDNMGDVVSQIAPDGSVIYVSPSCATIFGFTADELIGQQGFGHVHPDDLAGAAAKFQNAIQNHISDIAEYRYRHKDGHYVWVESSGGAVYDATGQLTSLIATSRDITQRRQAEEQLRRSEEQYRLLANNSTDIISLHELDGTCVYVSPSLETQTGWTVEEVVGTITLRLVHPHDFERVGQEIETAIESCQDAIVDYRFQCKDGSYIWVESLYRLTFSANGTPHQMVVSTRNITTRKRAELALKENEEQLRLITDNMSDVVVQISPRGLLRYVSPSSRDVLGYEPHELINEPTLVRIHPDDQPLVAEKFQAAYVYRKAQTLEVRYRHKHGDYLWMELSGMVVLAEDGHVRGLVASLHNIEARKRDEDARRRSEERLRLITDNIHDMISMTDGDLIFRYTSPSFFSVLGYTHADLIGRSIFEMVHPDDVEMVIQRARSAIERRQSDSVECRFQHKDGYYIWIEANGTVIVDENNNMTGAVFTARDISERRWMQRAQVEQERLQVALQKQQELNALKNRMMSRLSHELRTPLAVISTSADLLEHYAQRMTEDQRRERLQQICHQIKHFTGMLDNMSLVVKGSTYSGEFAPTPYDLEIVCNAVVEEVKSTLHATQTIEVKMEGSLQSVNSDEKLMRLILTHLLSNALKFSPAQSTISLDLTVSDTAILLKISDQGIGILPEDREHIFDPFRASNIGEVPGLGIGLSIVKDAVTSTRGTIEVKSEPEQGTQITVQIPLSVELPKSWNELSAVVLRA